MSQASRKRHSSGGDAPKGKKIKSEVAIKQEEETVDSDLKERFIEIFSEPEFSGGISGSTLKQRFGSEYPNLAPIINELTSQSRLNMSKVGETELFYNLVSEEEASQFNGLDASARMVYQVIERAGNMGIWTKDIRIQTNIQQQALSKIFKSLESRRLIKPVKSVTAKSKKLYMVYSLTPSTELTGGVWYSDLDFDHEFVNELRTFLLHCVRRLNQGKGVTLMEMREKMLQAKVSRVELSMDELRQLVQTLLYDYVIDEIEPEDGGEPLFVASRRVTTMCDFKWWDCLDLDFHFRAIQFEDGITLSAHEPHYHTE